MDHLLRAHASKLLQSRLAQSPKAKTAKADAARKALSFFDDHLAQSYPPAAATSGALAGLRRRLCAAGLRGFVLDPESSSGGGRTVQLAKGPTPNWSVSVWSDSGRLLAHDRPPLQCGGIGCHHSCWPVCGSESLLAAASASAAAFGRTKEAAYDTAAFLLGTSLCLHDVPSAKWSRPESTASRTQLQELYLEKLGASELFVFGQDVVVTNSDALIVWWIADFLQLSACATGTPVLSLDSEGEWEMLQLAHASSTLVTSNCSNPSLVALLQRKDVRFVGKDLALDRATFARNSNDAASSAASSSWCELTELLPFWRCDCSCNALCQFLLGCPFGWKALVNHQNGNAAPPWAHLGGLFGFEVFYAAADACFVVECLTAMGATHCDHKADVKRMRQASASAPQAPDTSADEAIASLTASDRSKRRRNERSVALSVLPCPNELQCGPFSIYACLAGLSHNEAAAAHHIASGLGELRREEEMPGWDTHRVRNLLESQGCGLVLLRNVDFPDGRRTVAVFVTPTCSGADSFTNYDWVLVREVVAHGHSTLAHLEAVLVPPSATSGRGIGGCIRRGPLSSAAAHDVDIPRCLCTDLAGMLEVLRALSVSNIFDHNTFALPRGWQCGGVDPPPMPSPPPSPPGDEQPDAPSSSSGPQSS